jgi:hypothetical protein
MSSNLVSVSVWTAFVSAYPSDVLNSNVGLTYHSTSPRIKSQNAHQSLPSKALLSNMDNILSPRMDWINVLCMFDTALQRPEWIKLASLKNLGALYVQNSSISYGQVDDTVVKRWSGEAAENNAFPSLKLILLRNQSQLTLGILEYLSHLPALRVLHITGPTFKCWHAEQASASSAWTWMSE